MAALCALVSGSCTRGRQTTVQEGASGRSTQASPAADPSSAAAGDAAPTVPDSRDIAEVMFDGGLVNGWEDWGWSPREVKPGQPARLRFDGWGGWMLAKPGLTGYFGGVLFRVKRPPNVPEFQELYLESSSGRKFPRVNLTPAHHRDLGDGWSEVFVPMSQLDPDGYDFERVAFHTFRPMGADDWILIDKVALTKAAKAPPAFPAYDTASLAHVTLSVDCRARATKISPLIYGINFYPHDPPRQASQWLLGAKARRWGGNTMTTYNWQVDAWNTGGDWFYENVNLESTYRDFLRESAEHGMAAALTVPIAGWVARDKTSSSFPVTVFGPQEATDEWRKDAGNGKDKKGKPLAPGPPGRAYVAAPPDFVRRWVEAIRQEDQRTGKRSVSMYILDNEPGLWWKNHRDMHPDPVSYDELVQRTIDYGTAIRQADPEAIIAGPAEWGWINFMYSARDQAAGPIVLHPDRRAHGDLPVIAYYLKALADYEKRTGVRVLDVLDLHAYPAAEKVGSDQDDDETAALRIRSTRFLWDPSYVDESWIHEPVRLVPRMREWVDTYYPGRGLSLGEWGFGAEEHMSGGLAIAEALGRFGQQGVGSAFYWVYPPDKSPGFWAFRAYTNYDGAGAHFLDWSEPARGAQNVSVFASRDDTGGHLVAVVLNESSKDAVMGDVDVASCGKVAGEQAYTYMGRASGFATPSAAPSSASSLVSAVLPPYSITVLDVRLSDATAVMK